ncbi:fimbrial protein [Pseudomonas chlororaphis]|uniref:fimbrial protein n=1 Tax=Pseudomonas chlororaphis TaxID=587753 RepID=UPI00236801FF|nr:fimbrial protein [Pseudomonas chlororaphis]WDG77617.1 fimbrial protein [Pseudomonas chlororaphis]WDG83146.1 fimbrial protein [Pseudomonas chlororaphis]
MRKNIMNVAVASLTSLGSILATSAQAAPDGTITINGSVSGTTCTVSPTTGTQTLTLDPSSTSTLSEIGKTSGRKPFSFALTGCSEGAGTVKARFDETNADLPSGQLKLTSGSTAKNVRMRLLNHDDTVIKIGDDSTIKGATVVNNGATLNYKVEYVATGIAEAGTANSSVTYSLIYE